MTVTIDKLEKLLGKSISEICTNNYAPPHENHCAHFDSHAAEIKLGVLCGDMAWKTRKTGVSVRVDEPCNNLDDTGPWG